MFNFFRRKKEASSINEAVLYRQKYEASQARIVELHAEVSLLKEANSDLQASLVDVQAAYSLLCRRLTNLRLSLPNVFADYFTKSGAAERRRVHLEGQKKAEKAARKTVSAGNADQVASL